MRKPDIRRKSYQLERNLYHTAHSEMQRAILNGNDKQDNNSDGEALRSRHAVARADALLGEPRTAGEAAAADGRVRVDCRDADLPARGRELPGHVAARAADGGATRGARCPMHFPVARFLPRCAPICLRTAEVRAIASRREGERRLVLPAQGDLVIDYVYYLQPEPDSFWEGLGLRFEQVKDAIATLLRR